MTIEIVSKNSKFAFYGAQVVACGAYTAIKHLCNRTPECFVVSSPDGNPDEIDGLPVRPLDAVSPDTLIIVAVTELFQDEICATLQAKGYRNIFRLTAREEHLLMSAYYASIGKFPPAARAFQEENVKFTLFEVRHHLDKPLSNPPEPAPWEVCIQAGSELTDIRVCERSDNTGVNISRMNRQYSEASAMYWVWKNAKSAWVGIEHYRRHLLVTPDMLGDGVDVIMPLPYICYPNRETQFRRFVGEETAAALSKALKALYPDKYEIHARCLNGKYHYAYNLIAAKKEVFDEFCEWAFRVTEYIETLALRTVKDAPRILGYVIEQLTSIYFIANQDKLTIRHAEKAIYT